jgi:NAD(P)-dependent dehydrogenase (short-subunit alcohol dehydrogenase family)
MTGGAALGSQSGRVAVVTGSSSGIGRAVALRLAGTGVDVVCADRQREPRSPQHEAQGALSTDELIAQQGGRSRFRQCDVADEAEVEALFEQAAESQSVLAAAVLCAGVFERDASILEETAGEHDRTMRVNERGVWLGLRAAGRTLVRQESGGRIVCIASISGLVGLPDEPSYCASKGAVVNLVRAAALDLAPFGITVNAVCPGFVGTAMLASDLAEPDRRTKIERAAPLDRLGTPEDVAAAVDFLVSADAAFITGVALPVDGGYTCR